MEKIDVLFIAFVIFVIIISAYIVYLKAGINFLCETLAKHRVAMDEILTALNHQANINTEQGEINEIIYKTLKINNIKLDNSSTGGKK